jgi:class 3 adenylate cyclase
MGLHEDLTTKVKAIFKSQWTSRDGTVVPEDDDIGLGNDAVKLDAVVLYADLVESTDLVNKHKRHFAAEIYKSYLYCAAKVIREHGGAVTAYDGDRIMAVYVGDTKNTSAAKAALKLNCAVKQIINPALAEQYPDSKYEVRQVVGVDASDVFVARTGIRGANDLVWVGPAANYAAKMCSIRDVFPSWITEKVYNNLADEAKLSSTGENMWEKRTWTTTGMTIYGSSWRWKL